MKLQIKSITGDVLYEHDEENNTLKKTLERAVNDGANLSEANLNRANLIGANLDRANLSEANLYRANLYRDNLYRANLYEANLSEANLSEASLYEANLIGANLDRANLSEANLYGANLDRANLSGANLRDVKNLPQTYINLCSRDILFILSHLKSEVPALRTMLIEGKVDGTQYEGDCACLIGSLANADGGMEKVCSAIPFYDKGLHNYGEQWFWQIKEGDTPETNQFSKQAVLLCDMVLADKMRI